MGDNEKEKVGSGEEEAEGEEVVVEDWEREGVGDPVHPPLPVPPAKSGVELLVEEADRDDCRDREAMVVWVPQTLPLGALLPVPPSQTDVEGELEEEGDPDPKMSGLLVKLPPSAEEEGEGVEDGVPAIPRLPPTLLPLATALPVSNPLPSRVTVPLPSAERVAKEAEAHKLPLADADPLEDTVPPPHTVNDTVALEEGESEGLGVVEGV